MKFSQRLIFILFVFGVAVGCARPSIKHEFSLAPGQEHHAGQSNVLLIPINRTTRPPAGLDVSDAKIEDLIDAHLQSKGLAVERLSPQDFQRAVDIAVNKANEKMMSGDSGSVSATTEFKDLVPYIVKELGTEADLVVVPNLAMRSAPYTGRATLKWDGVKRRESTRRTMIGAVGVASLQIVIYEPDGTRRFSAFGGLDRLFALEIAKQKYVLIEDRLQNVDNLNEGICIAFHPFFDLHEQC